MGLDRVAGLALRFHIRNFEQAQAQSPDAVAICPALGQEPHAFPKRRLVRSLAQEQRVGRRNGGAVRRSICRAIDVSAGVVAHGAIGRALVHNQLDVAQQMRLHFRRRRGVECRQRSLIPVTHVRGPHQLRARTAVQFDAVDRAEKGRIDFVVLAMPVVVNAGPAGDCRTVNVAPVTAYPFQRQFRLLPATGDPGKAGPVFYISQALHSLPWIPLDNGLHALARSLS